MQRRELQKWTAAVLLCSSCTAVPQLSSVYSCGAVSAARLSVCSVGEHETLCHSLCVCEAGEGGAGGEMVSTARLIACCRGVRVYSNYSVYSNFLQQ